LSKSTERRSQKAECRSQKYPYTRTDVDITTEATENAERVKSVVRVRNLGELCGSMSDSGPQG